MDLNKAKRFLDKINREFGRMSNDPADIARIDRDILMDYVRDFYDALLSEENSSIAVKKSAPVVLAPTPAPKQEESRTVRVSGPQQAAPKPTPPPAPTPPPVVKPAPKPVPVPTPPSPKPTPPPPPISATRPAPPVQQITTAPLRTTPVLKASPEVLALFSFGEAKELSETLIQPVTDIWKAIGLNDRLLYTKELFAGNQNDMKLAVENLNSLRSFEDAKAYLIQTVAVQNDWGNEFKAEFARNFVKTVRRRFL